MAKHDSGAMRIIDGPQNAEPEPIWPDAPRLCPSRDFPPYRYVRGVNPHPVRDPKGHMHGDTESEPAPISRDSWRKSNDYLFGIDLYHAGYFWEAHEAWEGPWKRAEPDSIEYNLLQALILNTAAQLKAHQGNARGARTRSRNARWRLARIRAKGFDGPENRLFGLDIAELIEQINRHYAPVWESPSDKGVQLKGPAPRLIPKFANP